jgi:ribonucleoside-diphosphate reductase alpha chain
MAGKKEAPENNEAAAVRRIVTQIRKRNGLAVAFTPTKIEEAIDKALTAAGSGGRAIAADLAERVVGVVEERFPGTIPGVEDVQDIVEEVLMARGYPAVARAYILYRRQRAEVRRIKVVIGVHDDLKLTVNAVKVLERRYLLRDEEGRIVETPQELFRRVARTVSAVDTRFEPAADVEGDRKSVV